jgi:hypothetical protein
LPCTFDGCVFILDFLFTGFFFLLELRINQENVNFELREIDLILRELEDIHNV